MGDREPDILITELPRADMMTAEPGVGRVVKLLLSRYHQLGVEVSLPCMEPDPPP